MISHSTKPYDFIFLGAGCASLSILMRMIDSGKFADKIILLVDKEPKNKNDRTWCFWEKEKGYFETIVHKKWEYLLVKWDKLILSPEIAPYEYKMIRGIDFYNYCFSKINVLPNIEIRYGEIGFGPDKKIKINGEPLAADNAIIFNSINLPVKKKPNQFYLLQHFKGWVIKTPDDQFNTKQGTLMDFNVPQDTGTAFVYVLPLATDSALVEYTLFTENLLPGEQYDIELQNYIKQQLNIDEFEIVEKEFGVIPMTNARFPAFKNGLYNIGTAGGQTKASTGYTFQFIQKHAVKIVADIIAGKYSSKNINHKKRFHFYDSTLLHILSGNKLEGKKIFTQLFQKNKGADVFKFLDNETTLKEDLKIIGTLPKRQFLVAGIKEFFKML